MNTERLHCQGALSRRRFLKGATIAAAGLSYLQPPHLFSAVPTGNGTLVELSRGSAPPALAFRHFPTRAHALVWRNWPLIPAKRIAKVLRCETSEVRRMARAMGLPAQPQITPETESRGYITVIRRNWHLLPYDQLLELLEWTPGQMAYTLREDDFLYVKLGNLKPECAPVRYALPTPDSLKAEDKIRDLVQSELGVQWREPKEPLFGFVEELSRKQVVTTTATSTESLKLCYSYLALYGDPLLESRADSFPNGYLARLQRIGVNGIWLHSVLYKLAEFPWDRSLSEGYRTRLRNLRKLTARLGDYGIKAYLYLNEPRAMAASFFASRPELKGAVEGEHVALCTSREDVRDYLSKSIQSICEEVPDLGGFFSISASENFTHCWSHGGGASCPLCSKRSAAEVVAEVNGTFWRGIQASGSKARLLVWDWGWDDSWAADAIRRLPVGVEFMSVSEWRLPIDRGGVKTEVGEYSISAVGPGPRASKHWRAARERGLSIVAKIQAGNTWELAAVPYIPALANVARHVANLREAGIRHLMMGWTLGGFPSPNLEVAAAVLSGRSPDEGMLEVATKRFGPRLAPRVVAAWIDMSAAFSEFPYHGGVVYNGPQQMGPANLLWLEPTGYASTMVGLPYDDLNGWRAVYPAQVFVAQFEKVATGFERAVEDLRAAAVSMLEQLDTAQRTEFLRECAVAEAAGIHFRSTANQARFVIARSAWQTSAGVERDGHKSIMTNLLKAEIELSRSLCALQRSDSRLGFEASNHYFYIPNDLAEKILNCRDLLERLESVRP